MNYVPDPLGLVAAMLLAALGVVAGGWMGTRGMLRRPPLSGLRAAA